MPRRARVEWSEETGKAILDHVAEGCTLAEIGREPGMPARETIHGWMRDDSKQLGGESFEAAMWKARWHQVWMLAEDYAELARKLERYDAVKGDSSDSARIASLRGALHAKQWLLERLTPALFGRRIEHGAAPGSGLTVVIRRLAESEP